MKKTITTLFICVLMALTAAAQDSILTTGATGSSGLSNTTGTEVTMGDAFSNSTAFTIEFRARIEALNPGEWIFSIGDDFATNKNGFGLYYALTNTQGTNIFSFRLGDGTNLVGKYFLVSAATGIDFTQWNDFTLSYVGGAFTGRNITGSVSLLINGTPIPQATDTSWGLANLTSLGTLNSADVLFGHNTMVTRFDNIRGDGDGTAPTSAPYTSTDFDFFYDFNTNEKPVAGDPAVLALNTGSNTAINSYIDTDSYTSDCDVSSGNLTADASSVQIDGGSVTISATHGGFTVPTGYETIYVLTSGAGLVIEQTAATPSFSVTTAGNYTIHTLVAETSDNTDPNYLDLSIVTPGITTGVDVLNAINSAGICADLDVTGAPILVVEEGIVVTTGGTVNDGFGNTSGTDVTIGDVYSNSGAFVFDFWLKVDTVKPGEYFFQIGDFDSGIINGIGMTTYEQATLGTVPAFSLGDGIVNKTVWVAAGGLDFTEWHHFGINYTESRGAPALACYVDGVRRNVITLSGSFPSTLGDLSSAQVKFGYNTMVMEMDNIRGKNANSPALITPADGIPGDYDFYYNFETNEKPNEADPDVLAVNLGSNTSVVSYITQNAYTGLGCFANSGSLTADDSVTELVGSTVTISATHGGNIEVPFGYETVYVLTSGTSLVIEQTAATPSFDVTAIGDYTIHTLIAETTDNTDPNYLDLSIITPGTTTGADVLDAISTAGICADLDVTGAQISVVDCTADAGTLTADATPVTLSEGTATISATPNGDAVVPNAYETTYVLTSEGLVIEQTSATPSFDVTVAGTYTIHTLVAETSNDQDSNYLDLSIVTPGTTTGTDVLNAINSAGICADLDVTGATIVVEESGLSIEDEEIGKRFKLYPNPANDYVNIKLPQAGKSVVSIYSILGKLMLQNTSDDNQMRLNTSTLPSGLYLVTIENNNLKQAGKLIIN